MGRGREEGSLAWRWRAGPEVDGTKRTQRPALARTGKAWGIPCPCPSVEHLFALCCRLRRRSASRNGKVRNKEVSHSNGIEFRFCRSRPHFFALGWRRRPALQRPTMFSAPKWRPVTVLQNENTAFCVLRRFCKGLESFKGELRLQNRSLPPFRGSKLDCGLQSRRRPPFRSGNPVFVLQSRCRLPLRSSSSVRGLAKPLLSAARRLRTRLHLAKLAPLALRGFARLLSRFRTQTRKRLLHRCGSPSNLRVMSGTSEPRQRPAPNGSAKTSCWTLCKSPTRCRPCPWPRALRRGFRSRSRSRGDCPRPGCRRCRPDPSPAPRGARGWAPDTRSRFR